MPDSDDLRAEAAPWVRRLAHVGYAAVGVVYALAGALSAAAAFSARDQSEGTRGALATVAEAPFGRAALVAVAVGLAAYAVWRFVQAGVDPEGRGGDAGGLVRRVGIAFSGLFYTALAVEAGRIALRGGGDGGGGAEDWTAQVLAAPFGRVLVGIAGAGVVAHGVHQVSKAVQSDPLDPLDVSDLDEAQRARLRWTGRVALAARGSVFALVGVFLAVAAWQGQSAEARGLGGVLRTLERQPAGPLVLGAVAVGLVAYGLFQLAHARRHEVTGS